MVTLLSSVATPATRRNVAYGPHDRTSAPPTVTVRCGARTTFCARPTCREEHEVPTPVLLVRQREQLNNLAHVAGRGDWQSPDYLEAIARD